MVRVDPGVDPSKFQFRPRRFVIEAVPPPRHSARAALPPTSHPALQDFHRAFITAVLPHIYGAADFERYGERIKRERGVTEMQQEVRRAGSDMSITHAF